MSITKSEWMDWKNDQITRAFFEAARDRVEDAKDVLSVSAGVDPDSDNYYRGFIAAYREMMDFKVEDADE